jgi:hypothetical protein
VGVLAAACSKDSSPSGGTSGARRTSGKTDDSAAGTVDLGSSGYRAGPVSAVGAVAGTIGLNGTPPAATVPVTKDQKTCGTTAEAPIVATAKGISNAVVWIADIKTGKSLPIEKRISLSSEKCILDPRVDAVVVGTTVNVFNDDKLLHRLVFTHLGTHDTLTVMPFFNVGQVVASERLAKGPGIVEVRCALHPWTHAYLLVFDHPYFAVTEDDGSFKIDSLPPGTYKMMVWHEGMTKPAEQQVQIAANGTAKVDLKIQPTTQ